MPRRSVSVVAIGLNEGARLESCGRSIADAAARASNYLAFVETIYVDSGSTDESVGIAREWFDNVLILEGEPCAARARNLGARHARCDTLLFLDGDMELDAKWLTYAIPLLTEIERVDPDAAGIVGYRRDVYTQADGSNKVTENVYGTQRVGIAEHFGGASMICRDRFESLGGFDPAMNSGEEPDLHARLRQRGFLMYEVPIPFITHHVKDKGGWLQKAASLLRNPTFAYSLVKSIRDGHTASLLRVYRWPTLGVVVMVALASGLVVGSVAILLLAALAITYLLAIGKAKAVLLGPLILLSVIFHLPRHVVGATRSVRRKR